MTKESQKTNTMTAEETARQNSFIELAKTLTAQKSNTLGRPLTYCLTTFGCQMNEKQSEVVAGIMDEIGYHRQDNEEADVVIYNTCTVRENANLKVYGRLGHLHSLKDKESGYEDHPVRLYDAGAGSCRKTEKELPFRGSDFWNTQYF